MAYSPHQEMVIRTALAATRGEAPIVRRALLMALAVEKNFTHTPGGHLDSTGALQQRPSQGWGQFKPGRKGLLVDINQFLDRARSKLKGFHGSAGQLAQAVQGSAYPSRYDDRSAEIRKLLKQYGGSVGGSTTFELEGTPGTPGGISGGYSMQDAMSEGLAALARGEYDPTAGLEALSRVTAESSAAMPGLPGGSITVPTGGKGAGFSTKGGGKWGGSLTVANSLTRGLGLARTGKRDRKMTSSGGVSDHWEGNENAFAWDLSGSVAAMDRAAVKIARRLGIKYQKGTPLEALSIIRNGYRIQVLYRTQIGGNHDTHIHVGVRKL